MSSPKSPAKRKKPPSKDPVAGKRVGIEAQPISAVRWLSRDSVTPNDYNPNQQPPPEFALLKVSILEDGWTQPIVAFDPEDGTIPVIVDGEHRWRLSEDRDIAELTGGLIPVVMMKGDVAHRMMSTIRHNRARGEHGILPMADIVRALLEGGMSIPDVMHLMQMEDEEVERLASRAGMPAIGAANHEEFSKGWIPE